MESTTSLNNNRSQFKPTITFEQRAQLCTHPVAKKLFTIMYQKKTNLALAADVRTKKELLDLVDKVGSEICLLKTHIDIIDDFDVDLIEQLKEQAQRHNFIICEDRKFADIGSTVQAQFTAGIYKIADWADIVIAHAIAGPGIIEALKRAKQDCALLLLAQLSCKDNLIDTSYTQRVLEWTQTNDDIVIGIIAQKAVAPMAYQLTLTPGVNLATKGDTLGQQYCTPAYVIGQLMSDIIIVGRGIYKTQNPKQAAQAYRAAAWTAYQKRCI